jgi:alanine racemase
VTSDPLQALREARATIDLDRLAQNFAAVAGLARRPVMAVVKTDAYGHGAARVAARLLSAGAQSLAVACVEEGAALRRAGLTAPVVVLAGFSRTQAPLLRAHDLTPVVVDQGGLDSLLALPAAERPLEVHVKLDSGMARLGLAAGDFELATQRLCDAGFAVTGAMTHLAAADADAAASERQLDRFDRALEALGRRGIRPACVHAANSAGLACLRPSHSAVRPGLLLYGLRPRPLSPPLEVRPVMRVSARVQLVRELEAGRPVSYGGRFVTARPSRIAVLPIGYADGVPATRDMAERGALVIRGGRVPVAGSVCMDLTLADVTALPEAQPGDEAVLLGDAPDAWELAERAGTSAWQVLTSIGPRVPRVYVEGGRVVAVESRHWA